METLKYKVIKSTEQYYSYCNLLEEYIIGEDESKQDDIELLELLIDTWDNANDVFDDYDPIELIQALMTENQLKQIELANKIGIGESYLSEILSYKKGLSKNNVQKIAELFQIRPEMLTRPYALRRQIEATPESYLMVSEPPLKYNKPSKKDQ